MIDSAQDATRNWPITGLLPALSVGLSLPKIRNHEIGKIDERGNRLFVYFDFFVVPIHHLKQHNCMAIFHW